jgi:plasmid stabilization system protein ParE
VPAVVILPFAEAQMADALAYTLERYGEAKFTEYLDLIDLAVRALAEDPKAGRHRPQVHPDAWIYPIQQRGRKARHLFLYRIRSEVEIARFLYDGMDLERHLPDDWGAP